MRVSLLVPVGICINSVDFKCNLFFRYYGHIVLWHRDVSLYSPQSVPGDTDNYTADIQDYSLYSRYAMVIYLHQLCETGCFY